MEARIDQAQHTPPGCSPAGAHAPTSRESAPRPPGGHYAGATRSGTRAFGDESGHPRMSNPLWKRYAGFRPDFCLHGGSNRRAQHRPASCSAGWTPTHAPPRELLRPPSTGTSTQAQPSPELSLRQRAGHPRRHEPGLEALSRLPVGVCLHARSNGEAQHRPAGASAGRTRIHAQPGSCSSAAGPNIHAGVTRPRELSLRQRAQTPTQAEPALEALYRLPSKVLPACTIGLTTACGRLKGCGVRPQAGRYRACVRVRGPRRAVTRRPSSRR
jgi:hypothetical protein